MTFYGKYKVLMASGIFMDYWLNRYPGGGMTKYIWLHKIRALLFHWFPAVFVDTLLFCLGFKPM